MRYIRALMLGITLIALVVACGSYALLREVRATGGSSNVPVEVTIAPGATTSDIATILAREGLISQPMLFTSIVRAQDLDGKLQAGRYLLTPSMTMNEILINLQFSRVEEVQFTIPEGLRLEEIAAIVGETGVVSEQAFLDVISDAEPFKANYFLLSSLPPNASLEGYLYPDTYRISTTANAQEIASIMLDRFSQLYLENVDQVVRVPNVNVHQIVTMASVVQRESARIDEMPLISAVFWNRLKPENVAETGNGRLQADATVQYALGFSEAEQTWWRKNLTAAELRVDSPFNTRERPGLPPGPIAAPGLDALLAAARPDESDNYLYFVANCALDGTHKFATSYPEFQAYEREWLACSGGS